MFPLSVCLAWGFNLCALALLCYVGRKQFAFRRYAVLALVFNSFLALLAFLELWDVYFYTFHTWKGCEIILLAFVLKELADTTVLPAKILPEPIYRAGFWGITFVVVGISTSGVVFRSTSPVLRYAIARTLDAWAFCLLTCLALTLILLTRYLHLPWRAHPRCLLFGLTLYLILESAYRLKIKNLHLPSLDAVHLFAFSLAAGFWLVGLAVKEKQGVLSLPELLRAAETLQVVKERL